MDRLMIDYLRNKGKDSMNEQEFKHRFKDFMTRYRRNSMGGGSRGSMRHGGEGEFYPMEREDFYRHGRPDEFMGYEDDRFFDRFNRHGMDDEEMFMKFMRHSMNEEGHFDNSEAKQIVSQMYHNENGRKHVGEKYDMYKAKEICERYKGIIPNNVSHADVYIAINAQYHDYCELFKTWFGDNIDTKIIESAIVFWFKDVDYKDGSKVWNYFKEM